MKADQRKLSVNPVKVQWCLLLQVSRV